MGSVAPEELARPPTAERLADLVESLRSHRLAIGADQCIQAQRLMAALASYGQRPHPRQLGNYLAAIFCGTPSEREAFFVVYEAWRQRQPEFQDIED